VDTKPTIDIKYAQHNIVCNCGHYSKDHFEGEGCCSKCGCTWYYPNDKWLKKQEAKMDTKDTMDTKKSKPRMKFALAVRLCVALLGLGVGMTLLWSEQWSRNAIWLPITLITVSVLALTLFLRATRDKKPKKEV